MPWQRTRLGTVHCQEQGCSCPQAFDKQPGTPAGHAGQGNQGFLGYSSSPSSSSCPCGVQSANSWSQGREEAEQSRKVERTRFCKASPGQSVSFTPHYLSHTGPVLSRAVLDAVTPQSAAGSGLCCPCSGRGTVPYRTGPMAMMENRYGEPEHRSCTEPWRTVSLPGLHRPEPTLPIHGQRDLHLTIPVSRLCPHLFFEPGALALL